MATRPVYNYEPIDDSQIRLLTIVEILHHEENTHDQGIVRCQLKTYKRESPPEHDALSYNWGNPEIRSTIECDGFDLSIPRKLFMDLKCLMKSIPQPRRPLWIDAICLDQKNDMEKAVQLPLMGNIYKSASRTVIWLGEGSSESDKAFRFLKDLKLVLQAQREEQTRRIEELKQARFESDWKALGNLLVERSWFTRLWVVQETALSKHVMILCGQQHLEWSEFINPMEHFKLLIAPHQSDMIPPDVSQPPSTRSTSSNHPSIQIKESKIVQKAKEKEYWKSYLAFMKQMYKYDYGNFWYTILEAQTKSKLRQLPSWCPDFDAPKLLAQINKPNHRAGIAITPTNPSSENLQGGMVFSSLHAETNALSVPGFIVDTVHRYTPSKLNTRLYQKRSPSYNSEWLRWLGECWPLVSEAAEKSKKARDLADPWYMTWFRLIQKFWPLPMSRTSRDAIQTLCMTLTAGDPEEIADGEVWQFNVDLLSQSHENWAHPEAARDVDLSAPRRGEQPFTRFVLAAYGRKAFNTEGGRVGIGPPEMEIGDKVCIFEGADVVHILRAVRSHKSSLADDNGHTRATAREEQFNLIGDAYVYGLMGGEGWAAKGRGPDQKFNLV